ncbi:MAG: hypothetical protein ACLQVY_26760 [Limisphaerales bacterium]
MTPEKRHLLEIMLDEDRAGHREAVLLAGARVLRHRRWRRQAWRSFVTGVAGTALAGLLMHRSLQHSPPALALAAKPPGSVTDAELLGMFPNTPVGLVTLKDGKKRLIFPRSGDQERFMAPIYK